MEKKIHIQFFYFFSSHQPGGAIDSFLLISLCTNFQTRAYSCHEEKGRCDDHPRGFVFVWNLGILISR